MVKLATAVVLTVLLAACGGSHATARSTIPAPHGGIVPSVSAQSPSPGTVNISWTAPTKNTDGSDIVGQMTFAVGEMMPCSDASTCASDTKLLNIVAPSVAGTSIQLSNVPDGLHCYSAQTLVVLPDGANVASAWAAMNPATDGTGSCTVITGSTASQSTPNSATNVKVTGS